MEDERLLVLM